MEYKLKATGQRNMAVAIVIFVVISVLSLGLCFRIFNQNTALTQQLLNNRQIIIMPMNASKEVTFNGERGDARYLRLMALSLVNLRLNVTRESVQSSHDLLLAYACDDQRKIMLPVLTEEKKRIESNDGSSVFYPGKLRVAPDTGLVELPGELQFSYGMRAAEPVPKRYQIRIDTRNEGMCFNSFVEVPVEK
jgi:conjugal transfer pilus assembly protein TraE